MLVPQYRCRPIYLILHLLTNVFVIVIDALFSNNVIFLFLSYFLLDTHGIHIRRES